MRIAGLWRYPVKSLRGEELNSAVLTPRGIEGDRVIHVRGPRGPLTGRTRHGLLTLPASTDNDGVVHVDGSPWDSSEAAAAIRARAGADATLVADSSPQRFDVLNLLVSTDEAVTRFGHSVRRLRPNIHITGVTEPEVNWPGRALEIGDVVIGVDSVRGRCIVTTIDPDSGDQDLDVLRGIRRDFNGELALNCWVIQPGVIRVGDSVRLTTTSEQPDSYGGWIVGAPYPHLDATDSMNTVE